MKKGWVFLAVVLIVIAYLLPSPLGSGRSDRQTYTASATSVESARPTQRPTRRPDPTPKPTARPVATQAPATTTYVLNMNTHKFHKPTCSSVDQMKESNKWYFEGTREEVIAMGYDPCGRCHP